MITVLSPVAVDALPQVQIFYLEPKTKEQELALVHVEPNRTIPLHSHAVDAHMTVVSGSAQVLSENEDNGRAVRRGDCVFFERNKMHGFSAGPEGLTFLSQNGGIRREDGSLDITMAAV